VNFAVSLMQDAEDDIFDIYQFVKKNDSEESATCLLTQLEELCFSLGKLSSRGHVPPELERINVTKFMELHFKPYRIIYEVDRDRVFVHCVLDGRRNLQDLLERRLLR